MITSIVVNYHCAALTGRAVNSLLSDMPDGRIVVVDNSVDAVEVATLKAKLPDPQVRLVISPRNVGFGAACNLAWTQATPRMSCSSIRTPVCYLGVFKS